MLSLWSPTTESIVESCALGGPGFYNYNYDIELRSTSA